MRVLLFIQLTVFVSQKATSTRNEKSRTVIGIIKKLWNELWHVCDIFLINHHNYFMNVNRKLVHKNYLMAARILKHRKLVHISDTVKLK